VAGVETLGSLCDKISVVKLKIWHNEDPRRGESLKQQEQELCEEIDSYLASALRGDIPLDKVTAPSNKISALPTPCVSGGVGTLLARLAEVNTAIWHDMEKAYEFEKVPLGEKDQLMRKLMGTNLERNACIDQIDVELRRMLTEARR
jgi:hypothetical protein